MPILRPVHLSILLAFAGTAVASEAPGDGGRDETLVLARSVMPRIAYRGLEPTQNPVKVESTVFPGRVFGATLDGLLGTLVGEDALDERAPAGLAAMRGSGDVAPRPGFAPEPRGALPAGGASAPLGAAGGIGGSVMRATSGIADTITAATLRAGSVGGGR